MENVELRKQLGIDEGRVRYAYQDHLGYWTIGVGRLIDKRRNGHLYDDEIDLLLNNDIQRKVEDEIDRRAPWIRTLDPVRQGALKNMIFQMGMTGVLKFVNSLAYIRAGQYEKAARNMLKSLWARQTPARAHRIAEQIRTGIWQFGD